MGNEQLSGRPWVSSWSDSPAAPWTSAGQKHLGQCLAGLDFSQAFGDHVAALLQDRPEGEGVFSDSADSRSRSKSYESAAEARLLFQSHALSLHSTTSGQHKSSGLAGVAEELAHVLDAATWRAPQLWSYLHPFTSPLPASSQIRTRDSQPPQSCDRHALGCHVTDCSNTGNLLELFSPSLCSSAAGPL